MIDGHGASESNWCRRLYENKATELVLYGRALGLSHAEAEDVLQETFLSLIKLKEAPREAEHYAIRAFRLKAVNYRRGLWRRLRRELEASQWFENSQDVDPREQAAMRLLADLPSEQSEVIVLKIWHGYTFEAIGAILDESPNTIAGRYRYGLKKLETYLTGAVYESIESPGNPVEKLDPTASISAH